MKLTQNLLKDITKLKQKKYREELGLFFVEGKKMVHEVVHSTFTTKAILFDSDRISEQEIHADILKDAEDMHIDLLEIDSTAGKRISDTESFSGIGALVELKRLPIPKEAKSLIFLDTVNDPGNLGTILRTADWFGIDGVLLSKGCVDTFNAKVVRSSMGSIFRMPTMILDDAASELQALKDQGFAVTATILSEDAVDQLPSADKHLILFGNESTGLSKKFAKLADTKFQIPSKGSAESLNLSISAGIVMSQLK